jgi:hypothetical protein
MTNKEKIEFNKPSDLKLFIENDGSQQKNIDKLNALKGTKGVYLITVTTKKNEKKLYIGSAYGADGFYSRWRQYINYFKQNTTANKTSETSKKRIGVKLREFHKGNFYKISFEELERFSGGTCDKKIIDCETKMKEKHKSYHTQMKKKTGYTSPNGLNVN